MRKLLPWIIPGMLILAADRLIKIFTDGMEKTLIPGVFAIHSARNTGAAMGILSGNTFLILIISIALIGLAVWLLRGMHLSGMAPYALSLIAGGALGNIADRILYGYVLDMFEVLFIDFYIFNMADVGVVCGAGLCAISLLFRHQDWSNK